MYARGTICKVWERSGGGFRTVSVLLRPLMHFSRVEMSSFLMPIDRGYKHVIDGNIPTMLPAGSTLWLKIP
jgi:hypothetical protein